MWESECWAGAVAAIPRTNMMLIWEDNFKMLAVCIVCFLKICVKKGFLLG